MITPETRVAQLLEDYPELEQVLIDTAPAFARLRNPVLRRTIARVTSLARAAEVAGIPVRALVVRLREAAGEAVDDAPDAAAAPAAAADGPASWVDPAQVRWTVDAEALLAAGQEPVSEVMQRCRELGLHDLGLIRSSFRPAPLIEVLEGKGYRTAVVRSEDSFVTFVGVAP
jgi:hypothetical protein